jgi:hypothetical protein
LLLVLDSSAAPCKSRDIAAVSRRADIPKLDKSLLLSRLSDLEKLELWRSKCSWVNAMVQQDGFDTWRLSLRWLWRSTRNFLVLGRLGNMGRVCVMNGGVDDRLSNFCFRLLLRHRCRLGNRVKGQVAGQESSKLILWVHVLLRECHDWFSLVSIGLLAYFAQYWVGRNMIGTKVVELKGSVEVVVVKRESQAICCCKWKYQSTEVAGSNSTRFFGVSCEYQVDVSDAIPGWGGGTERYIAVRRWLGIMRRWTKEDVLVLSFFLYLAAKLSLWKVVVKENSTSLLEEKRNI